MIINGTQAEIYRVSAPAAPPEPAEALSARLLEACAVLTAPHGHHAVREANQWVLDLCRSEHCWPACLLALEAAPPASAHALLSLCLSLVRHNQLARAPPPAALAPLVRRLWHGAAQPSPLQRQGSALLCALACVEPHECDLLLSWALGQLTTAEAPLALHVLQDLAFEGFHRPLQSKPLARLLREASADVLAFIEARAADPALLPLAISCLQQWVHAGVVLSDLAELPHLAHGLIACLRHGAPQLASEVLYELVSSVECLPTRSAAVVWLTRQLADVPAEGSSSDRLHALCRVVHALLRCEANELLQPELRPHSEALVSQLLRAALGAHGETLELQPAWELLLHPAAWGAVHSRPERAHSFFGAACFAALLDLALLRAQHAGGEEEAFTRWRGDELRETLGLISRELGQPAACQRVGAALHSALARADARLLEAAVYAATHLLRAAPPPPPPPPCWAELLALLLRHLAAAADARLSLAALHLLGAAAEMGVFAAEAADASLAHAAATFALARLPQPSLAAAARTALCRLCGGAGGALLATALPDELPRAVEARRDGALAAACVWLACAGGARARQVELPLASLLEPAHAALERAVRSDDEAAAVEALGVLTALVRGLAWCGEEAAPPAPPAPRPAVPPHARAAALGAVARLLLERWLPCLRHAAAARGACCASEEVWAAAAALVEACCTGWLAAGWLSPPPPPPLPADDETRRAAAAAHDALLLLCCEAYAACGHAALLDALLALLCVELPAGLAPAEAIAAAAARLAAPPAARDALVGALAAAAAAVHRGGGGGGGGAPADEAALLPAVRLAHALLRLAPAALCLAPAALGALWQLALTPFAGGFASPADAECRGAALQMLQRLFELVGASVRPAGESPPRAAEAEEIGGAVVGSMRPRVGALVRGLVAAIAHASLVSDIEPAAELLLAVALNLPDEWRAALPAALEVLHAELQGMGRSLPPRAAELLMAGCLKAELPARQTFTAMFLDFAQVVRVGVNVRALERYSR
ncbi:hypothetical protein AB1Y20_021395 [Prymnesium parvum]|uniref:Uncharacterized protein n=1 Tax=Prymnesium parvum TaxID=97485 RepID=A0AB34JLE3_PRYPA